MSKENQKDLINPLTQADKKPNQKISQNNDQLEEIHRKKMAFLSQLYGVKNET